MSHAPDPSAADSPTPFARPVSASAWRTTFDLLRPFLALVVVTGLFCVADVIVNGDKASFHTDRSLRTVAAQTATVAVAALGMTVIIIAGGIDLSVGTTIALCATVLAWSLKEDVATRMFGLQPLSVVMKPLSAAKAELERTNKKLDELMATSQKAGGNTTPTDFEKLTAERDRLRGEVSQLRRPYVPIATLTSVVVLLITIGCGALCGFVNGALVSYLRLVPFIVSLGTMQVYLGLAKKMASETTVRPDTATQVPYWLGDLLSVRPQALWLGMPQFIRPALRIPVAAFKRLIESTGLPGGITMPLEGIVEFDGLPSGVWLTLVMAAVLAAVLHYTVFGRYVFALGSNEATARLCGINVRWNKIAIYTLGGLFVGIAGLYQFSRLTVGNPTSGSGLELKVIASVVIGGGSLNGGRGSVLGTLTGALIMSVITSGCTALGLTNPIQDMILGIIIVAAVTIDQLRQRKQSA